MKKYSSWIVIGMVLLLAVGVAVGVNYSGFRNGNYDYVALDINPQVEFIIEKGKIKSAYSHNEEGKELLWGESFSGLTIEEGVGKVMDIATKMGYLSIDATPENNTNAIKMTVVAGLTHRREVHVYQTIQNYLLDHEILGVIVENEKDQVLISQAKEHKISNIDKYYLIQSILRQDSQASFEQLKKLSNEDLIDKINQLHENTIISLTPEQIEDKENRVEQFRTSWEEHHKTMTKESKRAFASMYAKYRVDHQTQFEKEIGNQTTS